MSRRRIPKVKETDRHCLTCTHCTPLGEGDHICLGGWKDEDGNPLLVISDYEPTPKQPEPGKCIHWLNSIAAYVLAPEKGRCPFCGKIPRYSKALKLVNCRTCGIKMRPNRWKKRSLQAAQDVIIGYEHMSGPFADNVIDTVEDAN